MERTQTATTQRPQQPLPTRMTTTGGPAVCSPDRHSGGGGGAVERMTRGSEDRAGRLRGHRSGVIPDVTPDVAPGVKQGADRGQRSTVARGAIQGAARSIFRGRGASSNPANRFEPLSLHVLDEHREHVLTHESTDRAGRWVETKVYADRTKRLINPVDSPDVPFKWTINPYRGCEHGCAYCYARPTHEALGFSSGLDFESKIMAKLDAPRLLREEFARSGWQGEPIVMSGVTDPYQPVEAQLDITRRLLEVMVECRQPVSIITKSRLVLRDLDLLTELAKHRAVRVAVSVTTLDNALSAKLEPRASSPRDRLWVIQRLAAAGIPVTAMVAPIIPAVTDRETPAILKAVADAGATSAGYVLLRLPHQNKRLWRDWMDEHLPGRADHVESLLRQVHGGELYRSTFGHRQRGQGPYAAHLASTFKVFADRYGLGRAVEPLNSADFRRPVDQAQLALFDAA